MKTIWKVKMGLRKFDTDDTSVAEERRDHHPYRDIADRIGFISVKVGRVVSGVIAPKVGELSAPPLNKRTYPKSGRPITTRQSCVAIRCFFVERNMCVGKPAISRFEVSTESEMLAKIKCSKADGDFEKVVYTEDILAVFTYHTKAVLFGIGDLLRSFQKSACYK